MLNIVFQINGRQVTVDESDNGPEGSTLRAIEETIRSELAGLRDPETGEFPVITIHGPNVDSLSMRVSGSENLVERVTDRLNSSGRIRADRENDQMNSAPRAFLCHASEDKKIVRSIAEKCQENGIDTFLDEWEIGPGDSLRRKIEEGINGCTHFIALLTPISIRKDWVNEEIDAAFVQNIEGKCKFIPLRHKLELKDVPLLLKGKYSLEINSDNEQSRIENLISFIHGISHKPPIGEPPSIIRESSKRNLGLGISPAAEAIVRLLVESSENGNSQMDPVLSPDELRRETMLNDDDIMDAVDELERQGFVTKLHEMSTLPFDFAGVYPTTALFTTFDKEYKDWDPEADALRIAADLVNGVDSDSVPVLAERYGWRPRRMNPAVNYLVDNSLCNTTEEYGSHPWCRHSIQRSSETRRFVRDQS